MLLEPLDVWVFGNKRITCCYRAIGCAGSLETRG